MNKYSQRCACPGRDRRKKKHHREKLLGKLKLCWKTPTGFPRWPSCYESAYQCRGTGSIPGLGRLHLLGATKPKSQNYWVLDPVFHNKKSHRNEKPLLQLESSPGLPSQRKPGHSNKYPAQNKQNKKLCVLTNIPPCLGPDRPLIVHDQAGCHHGVPLCAGVSLAGVNSGI